MNLPSRTYINFLFDTTIERIDKNTKSRPIIQKEQPVVQEVVTEEAEPLVQVEENEEPVEVEEVKNEPAKKEKKEEKSFEQISIFDIDDE